MRQASVGMGNGEKAGRVGRGQLTLGSQSLILKALGGTEGEKLVGTDPFVLNEEAVVSVWRVSKGETLGVPGGDDQGTQDSGPDGRTRMPETLRRRSSQSLMLSCLWVRA